MDNRDESEFTFFSIGRICVALREDGIYPKFIELLTILVIDDNTASLHSFSSAVGIGSRSQVIPGEFESIFCISFIDMSWKPTNLDGETAPVEGCRSFTLSNWSQMHFILLLKKMWKLWANSFCDSHFGRGELFRRWSSLSVRRKICNTAMYSQWRQRDEISLTPTEVPIYPGFNVNEYSGTTSSRSPARCLLHGLSDSKRWP